MKQRYLEPIERLSEMLFGLIMVLSFTGSLSVSEAGRTEVRTMLIGALGCNLAWGIIDAVFSLMGSLSEKGRGIQALIAMRHTSVPEEGHRMIAEVLPPLIAQSLRPDDYESIRQKLLGGPEIAHRPRLSRQDFLKAFGVFLWAFSTTIPVVIPFVFMHDPMRALRVSNAIAIALLFAAGYTFGRVAQYRPLRTAFAMVAVGCALVGMTIALGG